MRWVGGGNQNMGVKDPTEKGLPFSSACIEKDPVHFSDERMD